MKGDGTDYTRKENYKLYFHCGPLTAKSLTITIEADAKGLKKMKINLYWGYLKILT